MDEYVSKQAVFDWFCSNADTDGCVDMLKNGGFCKKNCRGCESGKEIDAIPAADVRPVKRGHWVKRMEEHTTPKYTSYTPIWSCSECGLEYDPALAPRIYFCYNCGADMREES